MAIRDFGCPQTILQSEVWAQHWSKLFAVGNPSNHSQSVVITSVARIASWPPWYLSDEISGSQLCVVAKIGSGLGAADFILCSLSSSQTESACYAPTSMNLAVKPWQWIHVAFAGPFLGKMFLLVINAHRNGRRSTWWQIPLPARPLR